MRGSDVEGPVTRIQTVQHLSETAQSLSKTIASIPAISASEEQNREEIVQLPGNFESTATLRLTQRPRQNFPSLRIVNTYLNEDLSNPDRTGQQIHNGPGALGIRDD